MKNTLFLVLLLILPMTSFSSPIEVIEHSGIGKEEGKDKNNKTNKPSKKKQIKKKVVDQNIGRSSDLDEVKQLDRNSGLEIKNYLSKSAIAVWDFTNKFDVKTGTVIKGILLNSVVSSNLESPLLVETVEDYAGIPLGSKFSCAGATKKKRVLAVCNKLITENEEYEVDIILLNNDGTAGLLGKLYSGKEQYAVGAMTAAALKSALDVSLDRVNTSFGTESITTTGRNKIKSGSIGALDEIIQMSTDEFKNQEPKIAIDAGKQVLIYFNRRFKL